MLISQIWIKESTPILFQMNNMPEDIKMKQFVVPDLHFSGQEYPPKSGNVSDGCQI